MRSILVFVLGIILGTSVVVLITFFNMFRSHGLLAMRHIGGAGGDLLKSLPISQTLALLAIRVSVG
jgi:hypothetical protein